MSRNISKSNIEDFESKKNNSLSLLDDSNLDSELKTLLIGGEPSGLELSKNLTRINTDVQLGDIVGNVKSTGGFYMNDGQRLVFNNNSVDFGVFGGSTYISSSTFSAINYLDFYVNGVKMMTLQQGALADELLTAYDTDILIEKGNKIVFDAADSQDYINVNIVDGTDYMYFYLDNTQVLLLEDDGHIHFKNDFLLDATTDNHIDFQEGASGSSRFRIDSAEVSIPAAHKICLDGSSGHTYLTESSADVLDIYVGGDIAIKILEGSGLDRLVIPSGWKLYFDGGTGTNTYIEESSADVLDIKVGGDMIFQITESGADGNTIDIDNACIGFTQLEPAYDASDTLVDFRFSNKQFVTFGAGNITNLNLYFPLVSGNFVLLIKQDGTGSRTITNYKVREFDESLADGESAVKFAGGSNPTLTTDGNHVDILSFYWDADNEIAYGVATLDFQF